MPSSGKEIQAQRREEEKVADHEWLIDGGVLYARAQDGEGRSGGRWRVVEPKEKNVQSPAGSSR